MNLNRLRNALSPAAGERQRDESEDGDERELGFTMRTAAAAASGGAAAPFGTVAFTDVRGHLQMCGHIRLILRIVKRSMISGLPLRILCQDGSGPLTPLGKITYFTRQAERT